MATQWISPTWRMPEESNQSKFENYSLEFDGSSNQLIDLGTVFDDVFTGDSWTVSSWIYASANTSFDNFFNKGTTVQFYLFSNKIQIYLQPSGIGIWPLESTATLSLNTWYNIVFTRSGNENKLYINGTLDNSATSTGSISSQPTGHLTIGVADGGIYGWEGKLTEYSIFDYALTDGTGGTTNQIGDLYNSGTPVNPMALMPAPVAYYPLGGSSTGSADDPANTLTVPNSSVPSATVFDFTGVNDVYVDAGNDSSINFTSAFSVGFWFKTSSTATMYTSHGATGDIKYFLQFGGSINRLRLQIYDGTGTVLQVDNTQSTFYDNNWHHLAFTTDGTTAANKVIIYFDGQPLSTTGTLPNNGIKNTSGSLKIGAYVTTQNTFDGELSNFSTFNTELPATGTESVESLYNYGTPPNIASYSGLQGWWKMNVDTSTWFDKINNVTPLNEWWVGNSNSNYPTSAKFLGTSDQANYSSLVLPSLVDLGSDNWGISFWFNVDMYLPNAPRNIMGGSGIFQYLSIFGSGYLYAYIQYTWTSISSGFVADKQWHHCVITNEAGSPGTLKVYIDDNLTYTNTAGSTGLLPAKFHSIGTYGGGTTRPYGGFVSNVSLFNTNLDASAVTTLYNNGTPEVTPSNSPTNWWKLDNLTTGIQDAIGSGGTFTNTNTIVGKIPVAKNTGVSSGMTTANLVNSDLTRSIPYSSYSMELDGTADYIDSGASSFSGLTGMSVSAWVKPTATGTGAAEAILSTEAVSPNRGFYLSLFVGSKFRWQVSTDGSNKDSLDAGTIVLNEWTHIAATWNQSTMNLYINGVLADTMSTVNATGTFSTTNNMFIGQRVSGAGFFPGALSNVAVWDSALSENQILTVYNGGIPNSISSLSPVGWWSLAGDSYFDGNDWICPDLSSNSNNGTSDGMGGAELVGDGPGSTANGIATSMNIPGNLKGNAPNSSKNAFSVNMNPADRVEDVPA